MKRLFARCLLILVGSALGLLLIEAALRAIGPEILELRIFRPRSGVLIPRAKPYYLTSRAVVFQPNYSARLVSREFDVAIRANSLGFRERELDLREMSLKRPIFFVGDSYFFGWGIDSRHRISERLSEYLRMQGIQVPVVNFSFPGFGTYQYFDVVTRYATVMKARLVVVGFFVGNDFLDDLRTRQNTVNLHNDAPSPSYLFKNRIRTLMRTSPVVNLVKYSFWHIPAFRELFNILEIETDRSVLYEFNNSPLQRELFRSTFSAMDDIATFSVTADIPVVIIIIPDHLQVLSPDLFREYDLHKPQRMLTERLKALRIRSINLLEHFRSLQNPDDLYLSEDKHWNKHGHDYVARVLYELYLSQWQ